MKNTADINSQQKEAITQLEYGTVKIEKNVGTIAPNFTRNRRAAAAAAHPEAVAPVSEAFEK